MLASTMLLLMVSLPGNLTPTLESLANAKPKVEHSKSRATLTSPKTTAMTCKLLLFNNQSQSALMLRPGNSIKLESSQTVELNLITASWLLDTLPTTGKFRTLGEPLGECKDSLNLKLETLAVSANRPLTQISEQIY